MTSSSGPVVLILGAGANIGKALIEGFVGAGYRVAAVSRSAADPPQVSEDGVLSIRGDLGQTSAPARIFTVVQDIFQATPSVVIYNAAHMTVAPDPSNLFSIGPNAVIDDLSVMVATPWAAAAEAYKAWGAEGESDGKQRTFIYTGNGMPKHILPMINLATVGTGKSAAAYWVQVADVLYGKKKGWRFFYADERTPDGRGMGPVPGAESHAKFFLTLAEGKEQIPSYATFVDGKYVKF